MAEVTIKWQNAGWYLGDPSTDAGQSGNEGYLHAGQINGYYLRSYLIFDVSAYKGSVLSAKIKLNFETITGDNQLFFYEVSNYTAAQVNTAYSPGDAVGKNIFNDLGDGTIYGNYTFPTIFVNQIQVGTFAYVDTTIDLNNDLVNAINTGNGTLIIGLKENQESINGRRLRSINLRDDPARDLILTVSSIKK